MDRDMFFRSTRFWYPIVAALVSILLNSLAFLIGINWNPRDAVQFGLIALVFTMLASGATIAVLYRITKSSYIQEFTILGSREEYLIESPHRSRYRRIIKVRVNRDSSFYITYPPQADGELRGFRAYMINSPQTVFDVSVQRSGGRKVLFIFLGHPLKRGELIDELCIECEVVNSFLGEHEGVSITTDPGQESCMLTVSLPDSCPPVSEKFDWFVLFGSNQTPLHTGTVEAVKSSEGQYTLVKDFSSFVSKQSGLQCAISWRWHPNSVTV